MEGHARPPVVAPDAVERWRARMVDRLRVGRTSASMARARLERYEGCLRDLAGRLHVAHGSPHLGNYSDPTDEFVFIVLSRKTAERAYVPAFASLKGVGPWRHVLDLGTRRVESLIYGCGLEEKKATAIVGSLRAIVKRFGAADLSRASGLADDELFAFLASLPEVGPKSARCVMLYSFGRPTFPVDAHVGRVLARLGLMQRIAIDLLPMGHKERQRALEDTIPPDIRYGLHVNLVAHGRAICRAVSPACHACLLAPDCAHVKAGTVQRRKMVRDDEVDGRTRCSRS